MIEEVEMGYGWMKIYRWVWMDEEVKMGMDD
jgi:hypothetical protein